MKKKKKIVFTVTDGHLLLNLTPARNGGYTVTAPLIPELITEIKSDSIKEAFMMARDALFVLVKGAEEIAKEIAAKDKRRGPRVDIIRKKR